MKKKELEILYEDEFLFIINKRAGLLSIGDRYDKDKENLYGLLKEKYEDIFIVHRLDLGTSGAIIFAKSKDSQREISQMLELQQINKYYLALVKGIPEENLQLIDKCIGDHPSKKGKKVISKTGKPSQTKLRVIEKYSNASLLEIQLLTGRTHQIRVHLASIGHPLLVDSLYGENEDFFLSSLKPRKYNINRTGVERPLLSRQSLHSHVLAFNHPLVEGKKIEITALMPKDMRAVINQLRKNLS